MGVSMTTVRVLRTTGHDVVHLRDEGLGTLPDAMVLAKARAEARVVLTFDLDFGDLLAAGGATSPSVLLCRLSNGTPAWATPRIQRVLDECASDLASGAIIVIEDGRYRVRRLPIG